VTGGAGFIGSHLVSLLVKRGDHVRVLDNFSTGRRENLAEFSDRIELIEADAADPAVCARVCEGMNVVFHQAAAPSVPRSVADPLGSHRSNVDATLALLMAARDAGVRRFVYAASSSAYGDSDVLPKVETLPTQPLSPYAVQKLACENYCRAFYECYGLPTISLRYFNVFGPRQDPSSQYAAAIPAFIEAALNDRPPVVYGDGLQSRDFTYVDNVVDANVRAAEVKETHGEVVNIAGGRRVTILETIERIGAILHKTIHPQHEPARTGDIRHSWADITLAQQVIGYRPGVSLSEGLRRTIESYTTRQVS